MATKPVLKWVGGKTQLLPELTQRIPPTRRRYFEVFAGGLAPFFRFADKQRYHTARFGSAVINDANPELTNLYQVVRDNRDALVAALDAYLSIPEWNTESFFKDVRAAEPADALQRAARMIYLNKTAFNGLHRVNSSGKFNVPFGRYKNPRLYDAENLRDCSRALQGVEIRTGDFEAALYDARPGDVVYLDPPYVPISSTSSFTQYAGKFGPEAQERLAKRFRKLVQEGVYCVASNSDCSAVRVLYADFDLITVEARRSVNSDATKRGKITELIVVGEPQGWPQPVAAIG